MHNFIRPNKFKVQFTLAALLFGGFLVGLALLMLGYFQFILIGGQNVFLEFIHNSVTNVFSHFILQPYGYCLTHGRGGIDLFCFFSQMFKHLILQSIIFYLLSCSLYKKNWISRFWRIYFSIITLIHIQFYSGFLSHSGLYSLNPKVIYFDIPITTIALLGLFLLAAEREFLGLVFWRVFFFIYLAWDIIIRVTHSPFVLKSAIHGIIPLIPLYLALYIYAYRPTKYRMSQALNKKA